MHKAWKTRQSCGNEKCTRDRGPEVAGRSGKSIREKLTLRQVMKDRVGTEADPRELEFLVE